MASTILPTASVEQQAIIDNVCVNGNHVQVIATAGSGKSTLASHVISGELSKSPSSKILCVTYNRALSDSTKSKVVSLFDAEVVRSRVGIFTYHGLASSLLGKVINNDLLLAEEIDEGLSVPGLLNTRKPWCFGDFELLVIDEAQDLRPAYVKLILFLVTRVCTSPENLRILIVGDDEQLLYGFYSISAADARFLTGADRVFGHVNGRGWVKLPLSTSYRVNSAMCAVVNKLKPGNFTMVSSSSSSSSTSSSCKPVVMFVLDVYKDASDVVSRLLKNSPYDREETFVLCSSTNSRSPAVSVVNRLVNDKIPVTVTRSGALSGGGGGAYSRKSTSKGKVRFLTFCGSKGLEADFVIVINTRPLHELFENSQFVALTRARKELVVLHHYKHTSLEDLNDMAVGFTKSQLRVVLCQKVPKTRATVDRGEPASTTMWSGLANEIDVSTLFSFIDVSDMRALLEMIDVTIVQDVLDGLDDDYEDEESKENENQSVDWIDHQDELRSKMIKNYAHAMVKSFDGGDTFCDLTSLTGTLLFLALEYSVTRKVPVQIREMQMKLSRMRQRTYRTRLLKKVIDDCVVLINKPAIDTDDDETHVLRRLRAFAMCSLALDAMSYSDKLRSVSNFDWAISVSIFSRFRALWSGLNELVELHGDSLEACRWWQHDTSRYMLQESEDDSVKRVRVHSNTSIVSASGGLVVSLIHRPTKGHDDLLSALATACVVGVPSANVFVVNAFDGSITRVDFRNGVDPMEFMERALMSKTRIEADVGDVEFYSGLHEFVVDLKSSHDDDLAEACAQRKEVQQLPTRRSTRISAIIKDDDDEEEDLDLDDIELND
jgi:hypothetical protein